MSTEDNKWDLDRLPTKWERIYGSTFSILVFVLMSLYLYASYLSLVEGEITNSILFNFLIAVLLFAGSGYLLVRVAFGKRRRPSAKAIVITGYVIGVTSCLLLALSVLGVGDSPYLTRFGLNGLAGSILVIKQGKHHDNS